MRESMNRSCIGLPQNSLRRVICTLSTVFVEAWPEIAIFRIESLPEETFIDLSPLVGLRRLKVLPVRQELMDATNRFFARNRLLSRQQWNI